MLETTYITIERRGYKCILCEKCGLHYFYEMILETEGEATSFALVGRRQAARLASERATERLNRRFEKNDDPVPCPDCGHIQSNMLRTLIRKHSVRKRFNAVALLGVGYLFLQFSFCFVFFDSSTCFVTHFVAPAIGFILVAFGIRTWMKYRDILKADASHPLFEFAIAEESGRGTSIEDLLPRLCRRTIRLQRRRAALEEQQKEDPEAGVEEWEDIRAELASIQSALSRIAELTSNDHVQAEFLRAEADAGKPPEPKPWARDKQ